ncbi:hypothetical protein ACOMHN_011682 [Nucella lapillus]
MATNPAYKRRVCYYYDERIGSFLYASSHPMKPCRIRLVNYFLKKYGIDKKVQICRPTPSTDKDLTRFHSKEYIKFLKTVTPSNMYDEDIHPYLPFYGFSDDCPVFDGIYDFCTLSAGGSIAGAVKLNKKEADICINWAGGLHHAKKSQASGFCYINDTVLAILELLKQVIPFSSGLGRHARVLYVDIDVHHGDGVEAAFYPTDRVMTVSFHRFGDNFFPYTGAITDTGKGKGKKYSLNIPLKKGMDDESYANIFTPIMTQVMESYQPGAVVLQCGADSLAHDPLGEFNLTLRGHGKCVEFMMKWNVPLLLLGGGGYNKKNVARCWVYETAIAVGVDLPNTLPTNENIYGSDFRLHFGPSPRCTNHNSAEYLEGIKCKLLQNLREIPHAPGVQMQVTPEDAIRFENEDEDSKDPDVRMSREFHGLNTHTHCLGKTRQ